MNEPRHQPLTPGAVPDAPPGNLVDRFAPPAIRPFARLARWDRPIGWWLLLLPCWWSATLAADALGRSHADPWHAFLFLVGAIAMRGAGCTYNDIVDRDLDAAVERTRHRPIPSGAVAVRAALLFLILQALVGLIVLLQFNSFAFWLGIASLGAVALYPFLKRLTDLPQLGLGVAFSWGALLGWAAEAGSLGPAPVLLYLGGIAWTVGYDTIYALQDKDEDALVGVRSSARLFGQRAPVAVAVSYVLAVAFFAAALAAAGVAWPAWLGLGLGSVHLAWQVRSIDLTSTSRALTLFRSNRLFGLVVLAGLLLSALVSAL